MALSSWAAGGYKVAIRPGGISVSAPMAHISFASHEGKATFERPVVDAVEVEICFILATPLTPRGPDGYTRASVLDHVSAIHAGIEFLAHRLDDGSKSQPQLFLADRLGNAGYVLGEQLDVASIEPELSYPLTVIADGETLFAGPGKHPFIDPVAALLAFANALTQEIPAGQIITTGSLCGPVTMPHNAEIVVSGFATFTVQVRSTAHPD
ncbi:hydratase [Rhizobium sp. 32-5/1]|uniref:hydratase n=1 Tax=Rhizobium sp. 32-5/1 TaxID=3019602 RepID=UPI00240E3DA6|nr:hydratase [Rhizobium sp. 32-5/1]WEZ81977.1 hydratase [Rhizobium sp. 32-5/1]